VVVASRIEQPYRIRFDESGPGGKVPGSGLLRYAQDMAWVHSEQAGLGRDWYAEHQLTWLIRALQLDISDEVGHGSTLIVSTEVLGLRRAWAQRRSEFTDAASRRRVAGAVIDWMLLDGRGRPARIPADILNVFSVTARDAIKPIRVNLPPTPAAASELAFTARRSELDPMGHVNNAAYLDYVDEQQAHVGRVGALTHVPRRYRIEYVGAAEPASKLVGHGWEDGPAWCYRLADIAGRELVLARVETDPAAWTRD
jgi:acyl-ACP thioesterase